MEMAWSPAAVAAPRGRRAAASAAVLVLLVAAVMLVRDGGGADEPRALGRVQLAAAGAQTRALAARAPGREGDAKKDRAVPPQAAANALAGVGIPRVVCAAQLAQYADIFSESNLYNAEFADMGCKAGDCACAVQKFEIAPRLCYPDRVPLWARRQPNYSYLAKPAPSYGSCQWRSEVGKSLADVVPGTMALPLLEAKHLCMKTPECSGLTLENKQWTLRKGTTPLAAASSSDTDVESLVLLRGLCTCECSTPPPVCAWAPSNNQRLSLGVSRSYTCVTPGSPEDTADRQGPRCGKAPRDDPAYVKNWMEVLLPICQCFFAFFFPLPLSVALHPLEPSRNPP